ncbi:hypothetical protein ACFLST_01435 [Chloroflexota bacterium]
MREMRSAFEKALERAERLGKLSPEEIRKGKEEKYIPVGQSLADRYLRHGYVQFLEEEVNRYSDDEKDMVRKAALSRLVDAIDLRDHEASGTAMAGILVLGGEQMVGEIRQEIVDLLAAYGKAEKAKYEEQKGEVERRERELLHKLRISGSAVGEINLEASETWREVSRTLHCQFDRRLQELGQQLLRNVS